LISESLRLDSRLTICLDRAMELCKLDLVTNLVRELPELQGHVGAWYAEQEEQPPDVVTAIASHYSPRSTDDTIPADTVGQLAAVADKLDNIVGLFALGKKPSGSSDPYALRRQAQGLVDICIDGLKEYPINITMLVDELLNWLEPGLKNKKGFERNKVRGEVHEFLQQRLIGKLLDSGLGREIVEAAVSARDPFENLPDVVVRGACLEKLLKSDGGLDLARIAVRVGKILGADSPDRVDANLFAVDAERNLWETFNKEVVKQWQKDAEPFRTPSDKAQYEQLLALLRPLIPVVDKFFDDVMVNDPDRSKRDNRHGMLKQIDRYFRSVADFPKLQSLLP
ncbi:MAG: glycine--tRNA ligase subunit beta, partial [bacterium]